MKKTAPKSTIPPYEALTEKKLRSLGQKLDKLVDANGFKHNSLLWKHASHAGGLLWHLARHGLVLQEVRSAGMFRILGENAREATAADVIAVLRRLPPDMGVLDKGEASTWATLTPGMLTAVDDMITAAYLADPAAVLAVRDELPENVQLAIDFVRGRAGESIPPASSVVLLRHLVVHHLQRGLDGNWDVPWIEDGKRVAFHLKSTADVEALAARFGASWADEVKEWILPRVKLFREGANSMSRNGLAGLKLMTLADIVYLFGDGWWDPHSLLRVLDARGDRPADLFAAVQLLAAEGTAPFKVAVEQVKPVKPEPVASEDDDDGDDDDDDSDSDDGDDDDYDEYGGGGDEDGGEAEEQEIEEAPGDSERVRALALLLTLVGIERAYTEGQPIPLEIDARFDLDRVSDSDPGLIARLRGALTILGPARAHAIVRATLGKEFWYGKAAAIVDVHFDRPLVEEAFTRFATGKYHVDAGLLGFCSPAVVPFAAKAQEQATEADRRAMFGEGILYVLGRASATDQTWDPALDEHVQLEHVRFSYGPSKVEPVQAMLDKLPLARYVRVMTVNLTRCAAEPWRLARLLRADTPPDLLDMVFRALMAKRQTITGGALGERLRQFGAEIVTPLLRAIGDAPAENTFVKELERALAPEVFEAVKEGLGKAIETPEQELRRLAASVPGPTVRVYRLSRGEQAPAADAVARIGGTPRGVKAPPRAGDEAMEHIITLDLAALPELAAKHPGKRSVSLYLPDPQTGERHAHGELVWTSEDELASAPGSTKGAAALHLEAFDVPQAIFGEGSLEGAAKRVRGIIYSSRGYVGGGPLWLQGEPEEFYMGFLFQFDDGLCHINLGDSGVMYVFEDAIEWQCH